MPQQKKAILSGGTGLIGRNLTHKLIAQGYHVYILTRLPDKYAPNNGTDYVKWDPEKGILESDLLPNAELIINLAGTPIVGKRWSESRKKRIIDSRVKSAEVLFQFMGERGYTPELYIGASAIGIYGNGGEEWMDESNVGNQERFIVQSVLQWENAHQRIADSGVRTFIARIGLVLSTEGGMLEKMLPPAKFGLFSYFGNGQQWQAWIHIDDLTNMMMEAINNLKIEGTFNTVAPTPVTAKALSKTMKTVMGRGLLLPAPKVLLQLAMGEMHRIIFDSNKVSAQKIESTGFRFLYPELKGALQNLVESD